MSFRIDIVISVISNNTLFAITLSEGDCLVVNKLWECVPDTAHIW